MVEPSALAESSAQEETGLNEHVACINSVSNCSEWSVNLKNKHKKQNRICIRDNKVVRRGPTLSGVGGLSKIPPIS